MTSIYDLSMNDLQDYLSEKGLKPFHARQIFRWLYDKRISDFNAMSDISKKLIEQLREDFSIKPLKIVTSQTSKDGTMNGPNLEMLRNLKENCHVDITASGGIKNIEHIRQLKELDVYGAITGKAMYAGTLDLREAIQLCREEKDD